MTHSREPLLTMTQITYCNQIEFQEVLLFRISQGDREVSVMTRHLRFPGDNRIRVFLPIKANRELLLVYLYLKSWY